MGKYTGVADALPSKPESSTFQERVDIAKGQVQADDQVGVANLLLNIRAERDAAKERLSEINVRLVAVEQMLIDGFESVGVTGIKLNSGESISTQIKPWSRVEDKQAYRNWCVENGYEEALCLPWQTTNAITSERLVEGLPEPTGVRTFKQTIVVVRK
jgi:hypothetical protein